MQKSIIEQFTTLTESEQKGILDELKLIHRGVDDTTINIFSRKYNYQNSKFVWYLVGDPVDSIPLEKFKNYYEKWVEIQNNIRSAACDYYKSELHFSSTGNRFLISYDRFIVEKDNLQDYMVNIIENLRIDNIYLDNVPLDDMIKNV